MKDATKIIFIIFIFTVVFTAGFFTVKAVHDELTKQQSDNTNCSYGGCTGNTCKIKCQDIENEVNLNGSKS